MKPLLAILSYELANDMVQRHWPWYLKSDCDILGVGRVDSDCRFPTERLIGTIQTGKDSYVSGDNLIQYHISTLAWCLANTDHDPIILTEPDAIFFRPPPLEVCASEGMWATRVGGNSPGFFGTAYHHGPWMVYRATAARIVEYGMRMINVGLIECGFPDRWYGLMADLYFDVKIRSWGFHSYSQNRLDQPRYVEEARRAIANGAWAIHGVKSEQELRAVTEGLV